MLAVVSEWDEMRNIAFQRLNIYTIVATYGWPTALQATPFNYLLPPGVTPVQIQQANNNNQQRGGRRGYQQQQQQQAAAPAAAPAQAPAPALAPAPARGVRGDAETDFTLT